MESIVNQLISNVIDEKDFRSNGYSYKKKLKKPGPTYSDAWRENVLIRYGGYVGFFGLDGITYVW